jgi:hypothetical protein
MIAVTQVKVFFSFFVYYKNIKLKITYEKLQFYLLFFIDVRLGPHFKGKKAIRPKRG